MLRNGIILYLISDADFMPPLLMLLAFDTMLRLMSLRATA